MKLIQLTAYAVCEEDTDEQAFADKARKKLKSLCTCVSAVSAPLNDIDWETASPRTHTETDSQYCSPDESGSCGDNIQWELDYKGTLTLSGSGRIDSVIDKGRTSAWDPIRDSIRDIWIGDGFTDICPHAFENLPSLRNVRFPDSLERIESKAFQNCPELKAISFPESVEYVKHNAFRHCPRLAEMYYHGSDETLKDLADQWPDFPQMKLFVWFVHHPNKNS